MLVTEGRRPGRPTNGRPSQDVVPRSVRLSVDIDDALCKLSLRHGMSVHALLRLGAKLVLVADVSVISSSQNDRA